MLLPMSLIQPADAAATPDKPFYALGWSEFDAKTYPYLDGLKQINFSNIGDKIKLESLTYDENVENMEEQALVLAKSIKNEMDTRPPGTRYIHTFGPAKCYRVAPEDAIFLDHAVDQMTVILDVFLKKYKEIGGELDGIVVDVEYVGLSTYYLVDTDGGKYQDNSLIRNPDLLRDIVANPKYDTEIRPMLEEYGFIFYQADTAEKQAVYTELYSITKNAGSKYTNSRSIWNTVIRNHLNRYVTKWAYEPLKKYFPDANVSDYQSVDTDSWLKLSSVTDDGTEMTGGNSIKAGDTSSYSFYYGQPDRDMYDKLKKYAGYNDAYMPKRPFTQLLYYVNFGRYMYESTDTHKIAPWITSYVYSDKYAHRISYTPYYTEQLYHLGLLDPQPFLSYTYVNEYKETGKDPSFTSPKYILTQQTMNDALAELTRVAGYSDREPIMSPLDWNSEYILSGMYAGGRNIWRITPNTDLVSLEAFKVKNSDPTFTVEGKTVTFPGGSIIADTKIKNAGSCGYWVETAKDVMPVVTTDTNRYEKYPSLLYNFEAYAEGAFDYNTSQPKNAWNFTWKKFGDIKGESKIVTVGGNKKLSIIGNAKNWIKELPNNITAGDSYAEDQVWELTVTIPKGLSKDAQINILTYKGNSQEIDDSGFRIQDGKLYYATGEREEERIYTEMMEMKPGTYQFKRVMNFHHMESAIYSTYIVMDAYGKELKKIENVPAPAFKYITEIGFAVADADKAVIIDDFKIYVTGVTTDFGLYDAKTGQQIQEADFGKARSASTAYRLSWLNATAKEETATIKADITSGGKTTTNTLHTVKLQPGNDSVITGTVEVKEGQTVKVYLETSVKAPVAPKPNQATDPTEPQATEGADAPTTATKAPTTVTTPGKQPTAVKVTKPTQPPETQATQAPTTAAKPVATQASEATEATKITETTEATEAPEESEATQAPTEAPVKQDKGSANLPLIIVGALVVLAGTGAAVYFLIIKKKK